jgi:hypothetical protein
MPMYEVTYRLTITSDTQEDAALEADRLLLTGDDERLDLVTEILAAAEEIEGNNDTTDCAASIIDSCHKLDALLPRRDRSNRPREYCVTAARAPTVFVRVDRGQAKRIA